MEGGPGRHGLYTTVTIRRLLETVSWHELTIAYVTLNFTSRYVVKQKDAKNKQSHEQSAQLGCEAAAAIKTVASLTREGDVLNLYSNLLDEPEKVARAAALYSNALYGFCQSVVFFIVALVFCTFDFTFCRFRRSLTVITGFGAHQMIDHGLNPTNFFVALMSVIFGSIQAGNVFSFVPVGLQAYQIL